MNKTYDWAELAGRVLLSLIFIQSGFGKITGYAGTQAYMESADVPGILLPLVIIVELVGGLAVAVGWRTRLWAALLAGFCLVSAALFHFKPDEQMQMILFMKNVAMAGGFLLLVAHGAGVLSLDARRHR